MKKRPWLPDFQKHAREFHPENGNDEREVKRHSQALAWTRKKSRPIKQQTPVAGGALPDRAVHAANRALSEFKGDRKNVSEVNDWLRDRIDFGLCETDSDSEEESLSASFDDVRDIDTSGRYAVECYVASNGSIAFRKALSAL